MPRCIPPGRAQGVETVGPTPSLAVSTHEPALILIIDDGDDNRLVYRSHLERAGYRVVEASDATTGLGLAKALLPAVILMDLSMPDLDGWEATRMLKHDPVTRRIGIVALSAFHAPRSRRRARAAGADFFVAKPCLPAELSLHVSECSRRATESARSRT
jgi:CheY-like chemotaxis protein